MFIYILMWRKLKHVADQQSLNYSIFLISSESQLQLAQYIYTEYWYIQDYVKRVNEPAESVVPHFSFYQPY